MPIAESTSFHDLWPDGGVPSLVRPSNQASNVGATSPSSQAATSGKAAGSGRLGSKSAAGNALHACLASDPNVRRREVLTVEPKVNLLAPATGDRVVADGEVVRAGGTLTVCRGDAYAEQGSERAHVATILATMLRRRGD